MLFRFAENQKISREKLSCNNQRIAFSMETGSHFGFQLMILCSFVIFFFASFLRLQQGKEIAVISSWTSCVLSYLPKKKEKEKK